MAADKNTTVSVLMTDLIMDPDLPGDCPCFNWNQHEPGVLCPADHPPDERGRREILTWWSNGGKNESLQKLNRPPARR